MCALVLKLDGR